MVYVPGTTPGTIPGLDCSDATQADRRRQLADMLTKMRSGVSSVGDRGRSVQYRGVAELWPLANQLQQEIYACETGHWWPGRRRLAYVDHVKGL